jgi:hypothetical protein
VPVYHKPFTLVQELVLDGQGSTREALRNQTTLSITGSLDYQACDDKLCYNPTSVPLTWTIGFRPIVTQQTLARPTAVDDTSRRNLLKPGNE